MSDLYVPLEDFMDMIEQSMKPNTTNTTIPSSTTINSLEQLASIVKEFIPYNEELKTICFYWLGLFMEYKRGRYPNIRLVNESDNIITKEKITSFCKSMTNSYVDRWGMLSTKIDYQPCDDLYCAFKAAGFSPCTAWHFPTKHEVMFHPWYMECPEETNDKRREWLLSLNDKRPNRQVLVDQVLVDGTISISASDDMLPNTIAYLRAYCKRET